MYDPYMHDPYMNSGLLKRHQKSVLPGVAGAAMRQTNPELNLRRQNCENVKKCESLISK